MNEKKIAARLAKGDAAALGEVIDVFMPYVCTVARNFSRGLLSDEDIDDVAADVFYRLWNARERLNAAMGLRSYLSAITRNALTDRFRRSPPPSEDISELDISADINIPESAEMNELLRCLYEGISSLHPSERETVFRFYFNGETSDAIAKAEGTSKGAVDSRLHRARQKLKKFLTERGYDRV